ncbi:MAG: FAD-binding oxidoreductase, partial [Bacteroidota bacterium]
MAFSLFKKKKEQKDDRYQTLTIKEVVPIAKEAVNLVFEKPDSFYYEPGQFITIIQKVNGKKIRRAYSLCTTPLEDEFPAVTVKRVPGGAMSNHLNDHAAAGQSVEIMEPMGMFTTKYDEKKRR